MRKNKLEDYLFNKRIEINNQNNIKNYITFDYFQVITIKTPEIDIRFNCCELKEFLNNKLCEDKFLFKRDDLEKYANILKKELSSNNQHIRNVYNYNIHIFIFIMLENAESPMINYKIIVKFY